MREKGYILSNMDIKTYLELLKELKKYLNKYYFIKNGISVSYFTIIGIHSKPVFQNGDYYYSIIVDLFDYTSHEQRTPINLSHTTLNISEDDFHIFLRKIKLEKLKNKKYV